MKILKPFYYDEFRCIGDKCPETCCQDWNIQIEEDWDTNQFTGEFGEKIRDSISEEGGRHFKLKNNKCPLLNENNLCELVIRLGEKSLCKICNDYPRFVKTYGDTREYSLSISCPEVARILLSTEEQISFYLNEEEGTVENDITDFPYHDFEKAREFSIDIAQNRKFSIWERFSILLLFNQKLQDILADNYKRKTLFQRYNEDYAEKLVESLKTIKTSREKQFFTLLNVAKCLRDSFPGHFKIYDMIEQKYMNTQDRIKSLEEYIAAKEEFEEYCQKYSYGYENFMVYYLFQNYMTEAKSGEVYRSIAMMTLTYSIVKFFSIYQWLENGKKLDIENQSLIFAEYSRCLEHNPEAYEQLYDMLKEQDCCTVVYMMLLCKD